MWRSIAIDVSVGAVVVGLWYCMFLVLNRRRCARVLQWIESAFAGHGHVAGVEWLSGSRFSVKLRLVTGGFRHPSILVQLAPREMPIQWLLNRFNKRQETLTFEANLHSAPSFNLDVQNHRWCGRTRRKLPANRRLHMERLGPFVISSRNDWKRDVTNIVGAVSASRECEFLNVSYRRTSPHFSATVPLKALQPEVQSGISIFETLRELAAGSSTSRL
ncbi:MAG TPA: hypothetical protein VN622_00830 [Clostridia bacterium]|nr:hypothetical protein [Clostridia bacterium]